MLPGVTAFFSSAGEQNDVEAQPLQRTLTFEELIKQQRKRLDELPRCKKQIAPVWLQEELSVLDDLRDKTLLTTVVAVDRCLCNALCRGEKRCSKTRYTKVTVFIQYYHEGDIHVAAPGAEGPRMCLSVM